MPQTVWYLFAALALALALSMAPASSAHPQAHSSYRPPDPTCVCDPLCDLYSSAAVRACPQWVARADCGCCQGWMETRPTRFVACVELMDTILAVVVGPIGPKVVGGPG